jgi:predicted dehydrogenase
MGNAMIRLALLGCGSAVDSYALIASRLRDVRFTVVAEPDEETARRGARVLDATELVGGVDALLATYRDRFDALLLGSAALPVEAGKRAAAAGKHVLVKTSLLGSVAAVDEIVEACRTAGVQFMTGEAARFLPSVLAIKACLGDGKLGEPGLLRIHRWEPRHGSALDDLTADIDLTCWLFGRQPTHVYAIGGSRPAGVENEPYAYMQLHLGFSEGGMALIDEARTLPDGAGYLSISLIGSTGAAYADDHHDMQLRYGGGDPSALKPAQGPTHLQAQLEAFVRAIEGGREPIASGIEPRTAMLVAEAATRSMAATRVARLSGASYELS